MKKLPSARHRFWILSKEGDEIVGSPGGAIEPFCDTRKRQGHQLLQLFQR